MTHPYSIFIWQPNRQGGTWIEPLQAHTQEYALYIANLIHRDTRSVIEDTLFYGDNLDVLRQYIPNECVDPVYLDPRFNSIRNYNVLYRDKHGIKSESQITAFEDTWHWNLETMQAYNEMLTNEHIVSVSSY